MAEYSDKETVVEGVSNGDDIHVLGVVGIFFEVVEDRINPAFDAIFNDATAEHIRFPDHNESVLTSEIINGLDLSQLIPSNVSSDGYYAYEGSLSMYRFSRFKPKQKILNEFKIKQTIQHIQPLHHALISV